MTDENDLAVFVISVASELAGLHPQTIRLYEKRGLISPARNVKGARRYSQRDVKLMKRIGELINAGFNVNTLKIVMDLQDQVEQLENQYNYLNHRVASLIQTIAAMQYNQSTQRNQPNYEIVLYQDMHD